MTKYAAACLLLAASCARAQEVSLRVVSAPDAIAAPVMISAEAAPLLPTAAVSALAAAPVLAAPSLALAAPALAAFETAAAPAFPAAAPALLADPAAASGPTKDQDAPGGKQSAAALSEFSRLVTELMSGDGDRAGAAAAALNKIKEAHLNVRPVPKSAKVLSLKPMQIPAGMYEVQDKAKALRNMKAKEADKWLLARSIPYVEDYRGRMRPVDHHHEARAAWEADIDEVYTHRYFDDQLHGWIKDLPRAQFYAVTRAMGLFYDRDQFGVGPHDPNHLPEDVRSFADDPFRSVAWQVRVRGGYDKTSLPFAEFQWAQFLRGRVKTYPTRADFEKSIAEAMALVHSPAAKALPGYKPR